MTLYFNGNTASIGHISKFYPFRINPPSDNFCNILQLTIYQTDVKPKTESFPFLQRVSSV